MGLVIKTRRDKLSEKIDIELNTKKPNLNKILTHIDLYEKDNLETIDKLKRDKLVTTKKISGALRGCITAHGPITMILIGSATKRIYGALLSNFSTKTEISENKLVKFFKKIMKIW